MLVLAQAMGEIGELWMEPSCAPESAAGEQVGSIASASWAGAAGTEDAARGDVTPNYVSLARPSAADQYSQPVCFQFPYVLLMFRIFPVKFTGQMFLL